MTNAEQPVAVAVEDRALFTVLFAIPQQRKGRVLDGSEDARTEIQAIARHRLAATPPGYEAARFLLWQYDRKGPLADCAEAWEQLRAMLAASPSLGGPSE